MKIVGLTGGIGSGKTTVAKLFKELGVPIYFADDHAKRLMNASKTIKNKLIKEFGEAAFINKKLNRAYLAKIVFNDKAKLAAINAIVHPSVRNSFKRWVSKQKTNYVIQENAILFESGMHKNFDVIISVIAPLEERVSRVIKRDNVSKKDVLSRIKNQLSDEVKIAKSNYIIHNIDLEHTRSQVLEIHKKLLSKNY